MRAGDWLVFLCGMLFGAVLMRSARRPRRAPDRASSVASPFAGMPGDMHRVGCPDPSNDSACTDKVGGNTGHDFERGVGMMNAPHGYDRWYEPYFRHLRNRKIRLLEIGMKDGASAAMWKGYFPFAEVWGLDYDSSKNTNAVHQTHNGVHVVLGDQGNIQDLERLVKLSGGMFDIIIDDGGHTPTQQLTSFDYLFSHALAPGGVYSVEDVETSYWTNGDLYSFHIEAGLHKPGTAIEVFKQLADSVNRVYIPPIAQPGNGERRFSVFRSGTDALVETVQFAANIVLMTKKGAWGPGWDTRDQQNIFLAHRGRVDTGVHNTLGAAVDSTDRDLAARTRLLHARTMPQSYK